MKCIFCLKEFDKGSKEHIFPESIGGNLTINTVCKKCNSKLGQSVDIHLIDHILIKAKRMDYKLKGKSGTIPNIFSNCTLKDDPSIKLNYEVNQAQPYLYMTSNKKTTSFDDGGETINYIVDARDKDKIPDIIKKMEDRLKKEEKHLSSIIETTHQMPHPEVSVNWKLDCYNYQRCILKIAYEIGSLDIGENYIFDENVKIIRDCIFDERYPKQARQVGVQGKIQLLTEPPLLALPLNKDFHYAFLFMMNNRLTCYIRIWDVFEGLIFLSSKLKIDKDLVFEINPLKKEHTKLTFGEFTGDTPPPFSAI